ncbi:hypothetical protein HRbin30_02483 [bacterium HR30]|nr:hypothetical protein HRbin30_02483 [bacterium HR30]
MRDFTEVRNAADAFLGLAEHVECIESCNPFSGSPKSVSEMAELPLSGPGPSGCFVSFRRKRRSMEVPRLVASHQKGHRGNRMVAAVWVERKRTLSCGYFSATTCR